MSEVRVLVGTRKGAFVLTSDGTRKRWDIGNWSAIARDLPPVLSVDLSLERKDAPLPDMVAKGAEPFLVVGGDGGWIRVSSTARDAVRWVAAMRNRPPMASVPS